jgi:transcriptional regulator with XRE-family HTH domain
MIIAKNPFGGSDPGEILDSSSATAQRVGGRIRNIRTARGLSQKDLGKMVGLSADRVQQYENGFKKPRMNLIKAFAEALGVSTLALIDPVVTAPVGAMYALFEMENLYDADIVVSDYTFSVTFRHSSIRDYLKAWHMASCTYKEEIENAHSDEERKAAIDKYNNFKWTFPDDMADQTAKNLRALRIKEKIEELQQELKELQGEEPDNRHFTESDNL